MASSQYPDYGSQNPFTQSSDYNAITFLVSRILAKKHFAALVRVIACTNVGLPIPAGSLIVQPLVNQLTGSGVAVPHGQLFNVPYVRAQGGTSAIILDPVPGDIGLCIFCDRDISLVKLLKAPSNPGSFRTFDMADALYLGGFLNGVPTQYVQFSPAGIAMVSPTLISLTAPAIHFDGPVVCTGTVSATGFITV